MRRLCCETFTFPCNLPFEETYNFFWRWKTPSFTTFQWIRPANDITSLDIAPSKNGRCILINRINIMTNISYTALFQTHFSLSHGLLQSSADTFCWNMLGFWSHLSYDQNLRNSQWNLPPLDSDPWLIVSEFGTWRCFFLGSEFPAITEIY